MPATIELNFDSFSRAYNDWLDVASDFRREFADHAEMSHIAKVIVDTLNRNMSPSAENPDHPFYRYADPDMTTHQMMMSLRQDVLAEVQTARLRGYVTSFFATGGVNYADLCDLMNDYLKFADCAEDPEYSSEDEDDEDDEGDEDDEDDEDEGVDVLDAFDAAAAGVPQ